MITQEATITVVTVTYGRRWCFLSKVLEVLLTDPAVVEIVVVDNGSQEDIRSHVSELASPKIHVVSTGQNLGSAAGFKRGIEEAYSRAKGEFIWLLDDDNRPEPDCLQRLLAYYRALGNEPMNCLLALRERQRELVDLVERGYRADPRPNSFLGFHWRDVLRKIARRVMSGRTSVKTGTKFPLAVLTYAPYGGFLFHRSWVERVGLPDERFFLYGDDHEYTWRFTRQGGHIYLCANCRVEDLEVSWHHQAHDAHPFLSPRANALRLFYSSRNRAYLEATYLVRSKVAYGFNVVLYVGFMLLKSLICEGDKAGVLGRLYLFLKALRQGWAGELGIAQEQSLKL
jgi:GT2 family glycosyltransferase